MTTLKSFQHILVFTTALFVASAQAEAQTFDQFVAFGDSEMSTAGSIAHSPIQEAA